MDWIGSEIDWIGLGWIKKIGPMSNSDLDELTTFFEHTFVHFVAADDEDVQRLMVQPHSPSKPGISTLQGPAP